MPDLYQNHCSVKYAVSISDWGKHNKAPSHKELLALPSKCVPVSRSAKKFGGFLRHLCNTILQPGRGRKRQWARSTWQIRANYVRWSIHKAWTFDTSCKTLSFTPRWHITHLVLHARDDSVASAQSKFFMRSNFIAVWGLVLMWGVEVIVDFLGKASNILNNLIISLVWKRLPLFSKNSPD